MPPAVSSRKANSFKHSCVRSIVVPLEQTLTKIAFSGTSAVLKVLRSCGVGRLGLMPSASHAPVGLFHLP